MTQSSVDPALVSPSIRAMAVEAVLAIAGVAEVSPPARGILKNLMGSPTEPHEALLTHRSPRGLVAELDLSVRGDANALAVAAQAQEAVSRVLAQHGHRTQDTTVMITVL